MSNGMGQVHRCQVMESECGGVGVANRKQSLDAVTDVSYCSDNTMLLNDIKLSDDECKGCLSLSSRCPSNSARSVRHFTQKSKDTLSGCDIIQSPVNILSGVFNLNDGFDAIATENEMRYPPSKSK